MATFLDKKTIKSVLLSKRPRAPLCKYTSSGGTEFQQVGTVSRVTSSGGRARVDSPVLSPSVALHQL